MEKRNALLLLCQSYESFPMVEKYAKLILTEVEKIAEKEGVWADVQTLALSLARQLKSRQEHWVDKVAEKSATTTENATSKTPGKTKNSLGTSVPAAKNDDSKAPAEAAKSDRERDRQSTKRQTAEETAPAEKRSRREDEVRSGKEEAKLTTTERDDKEQREKRDSRDVKDAAHHPAKDQKEAKTKSHDRQDPKAAKAKRQGIQRRCGTITKSPKRTHRLNGPATRIVTARRRPPRLLGIKTKACRLRPRPRMLVREIVASAVLVPTVFQRHHPRRVGGQRNPLRTMSEGRNDVARIEMEIPANAGLNGTVILPAVQMAIADPVTVTEVVGVAIAATSPEMRLLQDPSRLVLVLTITVEADKPKTTTIPGGEEAAAIVINTQLVALVVAAADMKGTGPAEGEPLHLIVLEIAVQLAMGSEE